MENDQKIILYGTEWCFASRRAKKILDTRHIEYIWINIDKDSEAAKKVEQINRGFRSVPTILFPDGSILVEPSDHELNQTLDKFTGLPL